MKQSARSPRHRRPTRRRRPIGRVVIAVPAIALALAAIGLIADRPVPVTANQHAHFATQRINLNSASVDDLQLLPGVGPAIAGRIVENRTRLGAFASLARLTRVRGVGPRTILKLTPYVTTDPPLETPPANRRANPSANERGNPPVDPPADPDLH